MIKIILALVVLLGIYVGWHLWRITPFGWPLKTTVLGLFLVWMASTFVGFAFMERIPVSTASVLYQVGCTWLIAFLYLVIVFLVVDIATLLPSFLVPHFSFLIPHSSFLKDSLPGLLTVVTIVAVIMVWGGIQYHDKQREVVDIKTSKHLEKPLTIVMASDLHVGYHNRKAELARWVDLINGEKPDLVLIGGDILDMSMRPVAEGRYADEFRRIKAPVYTVLGNHEYYTGGRRAMVRGELSADNAERFFREAGITLLKDSVAHFKGVDVIGRYDRTELRRARLKDLAAGQQGYTIVLDHQPYRLEEAEQAGVDFQFSGHTHRGQVWPLSWITDVIYECSWGHLQRGNTRYYVSSGLGIWGPKIRVGTRSEYLVMQLHN